MPGIGLHGAPRTVNGRVIQLNDGCFRNRGPMAAGEWNAMGPSGVLQVGGVQVAVISNHVEPHDLAAFEALGIDPAGLRFLMLKSRVHWRAGLGPLARAIVECNGTGVCTSDYGALPFEHLRRPMFPLDPL
jgi:microcystin degradation protein MlrC